MIYQLYSSKKHVVTLIIVLLLFFSTAIVFAKDQPNTQAKPKIILIIDDMGNHLELGVEAIGLPGKINFSFLPHTRHANYLANLAAERGKEVLLHVPMSNLSSKKLGDGALTPNMNKAKFLNTLRKDIASVPHVKGINNHMGSLMTQLRQPMEWLMEELKNQTLYFIDSRTSPLTIAEETAKTFQLPTLKRDIFLDNQRTHENMSLQLDKLISLAKQEGIAVAIGHPHPETLEFLREYLPKLESRGVEMELTSQLLQKRSCLTPPTGSNTCKKLIKLAHHNLD